MGAWLLGNRPVSMASVRPGTIHGEQTYGKAKWIAERVHVQGPANQHPSTDAVRKLLLKMALDTDTSWVCVWYKRLPAVCMIGHFEFGGG